MRINWISGTRAVSLHKHARVRLTRVARFGRHARRQRRRRAQTIRIFPHHPFCALRITHALVRPLRALVWQVDCD
jgi:hypothetical protein